MEIVISAKNKAAAAQALERLKGIEGITIKKSTPAKAEKLSPVMADLKASLKEVKEYREGKTKLKPARQLSAKK